MGGLETTPVPFVHVEPYVLVDSPRGKTSWRSLTQSATICTMGMPGNWVQVADSGQLESGQAFVYQVRRADTNDGSVFALKRLKNPRRSARFEREVETMRQLSSSGLAVPEVVESGIADKGRPYVVTPWYSDGSLEVKVADKAYVADPVGGLDVLISVASTMAQIHAEGFAHRDLKPPNILVDGATIAIADFGLALPVDDDIDRLTATTEGVGSRFYIAPENESGINTVIDQRPSDFYAFAKVLYALLGGQQPRARGGQLDEGHRLEQITKNPALEVLSALQSDLLNSDPRVRLQDWEAVIEELENAKRTLMGANPAADDTRTVVESAMRAARRFAASQKVSSFERSRQVRREFETVVRNTNNHLSSGLNSWGPQVTAMAEYLGESMSVNLSSGGKPLAQVIDMPVVQAALDGSGIELAQNRDVIPYLGEGSPALFVVSVNLPPASEAIHVASYAIAVETLVWFLRVPIYLAYKQGEKKIVSKRFFEQFGEVVGPLRLGLASTNRRAEEVGESCGRTGFELLNRFLTRPDEGLGALI